jgi:hypothetical protein
VLPGAGKIPELEVDDLDVFFGNELEYLLRVHEILLAPSGMACVVAGPGPAGWCAA